MIFFTAFLCFVCAITSSNSQLKVVHSWKYIDYLWRSSNQKADAIASGNYTVLQNVPYDVQVVPDGRIFVTIAKDTGVPASLTTISNKIGDGGPLLAPYPDWSWATATNCDGITGVFRVALDNCNHLWVLDTGKVGDSAVCPAQLLRFNLRNDKLVKRVIIPSNVATNKTGKGLLATPVVYNRDRRCNDFTVYMADTEGYGLVVWDGESLRRIEAAEFMPQVNAETFTTQGKSFHLDDGLLGMAITLDQHHHHHHHSPELYFRPFASFDMYHTKLENLYRLNQSAIEYYKEPNQIRSQSAAQAFSSRGILFYSSTADCMIICWNRHKPFSNENRVPVDTDTVNLVFATGIKVSQGDEERLWVLTDHYERFATNTLNATQVNFRILTGSVKSLVEGTNCE